MDPLASNSGVPLFAPDETEVPDREAYGSAAYSEPGNHIRGELILDIFHHANTNLVRSGTYIKEWGGRGTAPGQLIDPHAITFDSQGRLFVADRGNQRIQIFDQDGGFIDAWTQFGSPSGIFITPDDMLYVADLAAGIRIGSARDGSVLAFIRAPTSDSGSVRVAESVAVDAQGNVYAGENAGRKLMKFVMPR